MAPHHPLSSPSWSYLDAEVPVPHHLVPGKIHLRFLRSFPSVSPLAETSVHGAPGATSELTLKLRMISWPCESLRSQLPPYLSVTTGSVVRSHDTSSWSSDQRLMYRVRTPATYARNVICAWPSSDGLDLRQERSRGLVFCASVRVTQSHRTTKGTGGGDFCMSLLRERLRESTCKPRANDWMKLLHQCVSAPVSAEKRVWFWTGLIGLPYLEARQKFDTPPRFYTQQHVWVCAMKIKLRLISVPKSQFPIPVFRILLYNDDINNNDDDHIYNTPHDTHYFPL